MDGSPLIHALIRPPPDEPPLKDTRGPKTPFGTEDVPLNHIVTRAAGSAVPAATRQVGV